LGDGGEVNGNVNMNGGGTLNMGTAGTIGGSASTGTLNYGSYAAPVTFNASNASGGTTGVGTTWSVGSVIGSAGSDTVTGTAGTYNSFNAATKGTFSANGVAVTAFENITDSGAATVDMSGTTTGGLAGNVTTAGGTVTLGGGNQVGGSVNMGSAGTLNMGTAGTITGGADTGTLTYANYSAPVTFNVTTRSGPGFAGALGGATAVVGSAGSDTITGSSVTWTITGANSGTGGGFNWSSFENLTDAGSAVISGAGGSLGGAISVAGASTLSGSIVTGGNQIYTGAITLGGPTTLQSTGGGTINPQSTVNGATSLVIATTGNVTLGGAVGGTTPLTAFTVAGTLPSTPPSTFPDQTAIPPVNTLTFGAGANITATSATTGNVVLSASNFSGNSTITTGNLLMNSPGTIPVNNSLTLNVTNFGLAGTNGNYSFGGVVLSNSVAVPASANIGVTVGGVSLKQSTLQVQAGAAASTASATAAQSAAKEAANTFGTDSVAEQIEYGFAGDVGTLPPIDHRLQGVGISVPKCFNESREGEACL
jgi:hypothetical protein